MMYLYHALLLSIAIYAGVRNRGSKRGGGGQAAAAEREGGRPPPPSVAVIGCGPGGMFLLHALRHRRARLEREGDDEGLASLPLITCFERSSGPGGVWRSDRSFGADGDSADGGQATTMYEALWTNGPKECMEFFDHTYQEHFGRDLPGFLPRQLVLDYLVTRCTKDSPDFFDDARFNTAVESVVRHPERDGFVVRTIDGATGAVAEAHYDVCVWAAGENGRPKIPSSLLSALGAFSGEMFHSSKTGSDFDKRVRDKRVMIMGDAYSAEDLTLQAIKLGATAVEIVARGGTGVASHMGAWPMDRVGLHPGRIPTGVTEDGRGIVLSTVEYDYDSRKYHVVPGEENTLEGIDTIIFCTGYEANTDMLEESLRLNHDIFLRGSDLAEHWKMPRNPTDPTDEILGDVPLGDIRPQDFAPNICPQLYRGRLISYPSMYFIYEPTEDPLIGLDVAAWLTLAQITGDLPTPSAEEMRDFNTRTLLKCMECEEYRYGVDANYQKAVDAAFDADHWVWDNRDPRSMVAVRELHQLQYRYLARDALDAGYPFEFGTFEKLNEKGNRLVEMDVDNFRYRYELDGESEDAGWRTFRDGNTSTWRSVHTGAGSVPLKGRWLELEGCAVDQIVGSSEDNAAEGNSLSSGDESSEEEVIGDVSSDDDPSREASIA